MTVKELLVMLTQTGCKVTLDGEQIKVRGTLTDEMRALIREHKGALVQYLNRQSLTAKLAGQMKATGAARFHSERLQETIYILRDWATLPALPPDALAFTLQELRNIMSQSYSDSELQKLAAAKREILTKHRQSLVGKGDDPPATIEDALRIFPGSRVVDAASKNPSKEV